MVEEEVCRLSAQVVLMDEVHLEIYLVLGSGLENDYKGSEIAKEPLADILDLFFDPPVGVGWPRLESFLTLLERTFGEDTIRGPVVEAFSDLADVAKRANNGGTAGC